MTPDQISRRTAMRQDAAQANYNRYWRATNARMAALQNVTPEEARRANGISGVALVIVVFLMIIAYACGLMPGQNTPPNPMDYHPNQGGPDPAPEPDCAGWRVLWLPELWPWFRGQMKREKQ